MAGPLAQLAEHLTFNERVDGSSPSRLISLQYFHFRLSCVTASAFCGWPVPDRGFLQLVFQDYGAVARLCWLGAEPLRRARGNACWVYS
jgi:hypothetical protein